MNLLALSPGLALCATLSISNPWLASPSVPCAAMPSAATLDTLAPPPSWRVAVTEFLKDPTQVSDTNGEWIEIQNLLPWRVNLEGWSLGDDGGAQHVIANGGLGVFLRPGEFFVLARNADPALNGGVLVDYAYSSFSLGNGADQIVLRRRNGQIADRVAYDDGVLWPDQPGQSISLAPEATDPGANDDPANWCHATSVIGAGNTDTGTPGAANDTCP